jgi:hypothetical protein
MAILGFALTVGSSETGSSKPEKKKNPEGL